MRSAAKVYRGEYRTRYVYHAQMEPLNATASVSPDGKSVEIWAGTQGPTNMLDQVARLLQTERTNITLHQHFLGGGYRTPQPAGRRARCGAPRQGGGQAGQADLEPRGRPDRRQVPADDGAPHRGRLRCRRQARRLAPSRGGGIGRRLYVGRARPHRPQDRPCRHEGLADPAISDPEQARRACDRGARRAARHLSRRRQRSQRLRGRELPRRDRQGPRARPDRVPARAFRGPAANADAAARRRRNVRLEASRARAARSASAPW